MADSSPSEKGSDQVPGHFCDPCQDIHGEIKPVAGFCINCDESLCQECYNFHLRRKQFRDHQLADQSTRPKLNIQLQQKHQDITEKCPRHHGETIQSFCKSHSKICCKVCITVKHKSCDIEEISKMARNIKQSGQLEDLNKQLSMLKIGFNVNLSKTETNKVTIQKNYSKAMDDMKKLKDEFDKLMTETENQAELVKEEDLKQSQSVSEASSLIIDQINKIASNLDRLKETSDNESLFIAMKRAENELHSFESSLVQLDIDNSAREYKFEPDMKITELMKHLKVVGSLSFISATHDSATGHDVSISQQMAKKPTHLKDINVSDKNLHHHGTVVLPNEKLLLTDYHNKTVKLIDTNKGTTVTETQLSGTPVNITKVKTDEVAVILHNPNKIQFMNLSENMFVLGRELSVNGQCYGIAYNDKDQTFIMVFRDEEKVLIINMAGNIVKTIQTDSNGSKLFKCPYEVSLSPNMSGMYVSDLSNNRVTLLSLNGDVKAVYKENGLRGPIGICVHKSGVLYAVCFNSHTVHQLDPDSGDFKLLLDKKDGLNGLFSISYCDVEDKLYVGMVNSSILKVFKMK